jgi:hypothetical protein
VGWIYDFVTLNEQVDALNRSQTEIRDPVRRES